VPIVRVVGTAIRERRGELIVAINAQPQRAREAVSRGAMPALTWLGFEPLRGDKPVDLRVLFDGRRVGWDAGIRAETGKRSEPVDA